jgi:hypothetical protein
MRPSRNKTHLARTSFPSSNLGTHPPGSSASSLHPLESLPILPLRATFWARPTQDGRTLGCSPPTPGQTSTVTRPRADARPLSHAPKSKATPSLVQTAARRATFWARPRLPPPRTSLHAICSIAPGIDPPAFRSTPAITTVLEPVCRRKYDPRFCRDKCVLRGPDSRSEFR